MAEITAAMLKEKLTKELDALHVEIEDVSDGCGKKFIAKIVSSKFNNLPLLDQHRLVNDTIGDEWMQSIHSFRMKTMTPEKYNEIKS